MTDKPDLVVGRCVPLPSNPDPRPGGVVIAEFREALDTAKMAARIVELEAENLNLRHQDADTANALRQLHEENARLAADNKALRDLFKANPSALWSQVARLREALEPFATEAQFWDQKRLGRSQELLFPDGRNLGPGDITIGHLRRAREVYGPLSSA